MILNAQRKKESLGIVWLGLVDLTSRRGDWALLATAWVLHLQTNFSVQRPLLRLALWTADHSCLLGMSRGFHPPAEWLKGLWIDDFVLVAANLVNRGWHFVYNQRKIQRTLLWWPKLREIPISWKKSSLLLKWNTDANPPWVLGWSEFHQCCYRFANYQSRCWTADWKRISAHLEPVLETSTLPTTSFVWSIQNNLDFQRARKWEERF